MLLIPAMYGGFFFMSMEKQYELLAFLEFVEKNYYPFGFNYIRREDEYICTKIDVCSQYIASLQKGK